MISKDMEICGITAEYNPLHNGHVYHIGETRRNTGCDAVAVAMSGDFVQRGEPAVLDKWVRAEHALRAGADLVMEIPVIFCLGNAAQYASAGVRLLEAAGCSRISFGSEDGDTDRLVRVAGVISENRDAIDTYINDRIRDGMSYPAARSEAYRNIRACSLSAAEIEAELAVLGNPNDILAVEYIMSMTNAVPCAVNRQGAGYNSRGRNDGMKYQSAAYLREVIRTGNAGYEELGRNVPGYVRGSFAEHKAVSADNCFLLLKYAVRSMTADEIDECPSGGEGLGNLIRSVAGEAENFDDIVRRVKSRRYTYTRISRLCMQILLGITRYGFDFSGPGYIRVLGHNDKGREVLNSLRKISGLPLITNINKEREKLDDAALAQLEMDIHAAEIYDLIASGGRPGYAEQRMRPVML